jgi:hypothetical protein
MKKILLIATMVGVCGLLRATTITAPSSLLPLNGANAYSWGISIPVPAGQAVTSAQINFTGITLTGSSTGSGYLYTSLLNSQTTGVTKMSDGDAAGNYWATQFSGANITSIGTQFFAKVGTALTWSYVLNASQLAALNSYLTSGSFNIGLDPDCNYNTGSISFTYTVGPPEPPSVPDAALTAFLMVIGLAGLELFRRQFVPATIKA